MPPPQEAEERCRGRFRRSHKSEVQSSVPAAVGEFVDEKLPGADVALEAKLGILLRDPPMYTSTDFKRIIDVWLKRRDGGEIFSYS